MAISLASEGVVIDAAGSTISDVSWIPGTHLLVSGTDTGRTRIWGRPEQVQAFGLSPLHAPLVVAKSDPGNPAPQLKTWQ